MKTVKKKERLTILISKNTEKNMVKYCSCVLSKLSLLVAVLIYLGRGSSFFVQKSSAILRLSETFYRIQKYSKFI